jgi:hypothetical protein
MSGILVEETGGARRRDLRLRLGENGLVIARSTAVESPHAGVAIDGFAPVNTVGFERKRPVEIHPYPYPRAGRTPDAGL